MLIENASIFLIFSEVLVLKKRYEVGIEKLDHAGSQISIMQESLEALQPQLVEAAAKVQDTVKKVEAESAEAAEVEKTVVADEEVANEQVNFVSILTKG